MSVPVFNLKNYQIQTLGALRKFLEKTVEFNDADTAFYALTKRPFVPVPSLPGLPYVCLRIPTGGGKTILAAHSIAVAADIAPKFYPVLSSFPALGLPLWAGDTAGDGAELFTLRSVRARRGLKVEANSAGVCHPICEWGREPL